MQKIIELTHKTVLVVGLPSKEKLKELDLFIDDINLVKCKISHRLETNLLSLYDGHVKSNKTTFRGKHGHLFNIKLPNGDWELVGIHPELTEEECKRVVFGIEDGEHSRYQCYTDMFRTFSTAKESFDTLMQKLECYTVNPYSKPDGETYHFMEIYISDFDKWQQAEQSTFPKFAVLIRKK